MIRTDPFLNRVPRHNYNCLDFVREVWLASFGEDIRAKLVKLQGAFSQRKVTLSGVKGFKTLSHPVSPCFAVMQRPKTTPHVGIYLDGRILHMHDKGVEFQPPNVAKHYFHTIRYYQ